MTESSHRHLFLSPHYDDIPLSCGGTVALLSSRGLKPEVALLFGDYPDPEAPLTPFAEHLHREWGFAAEDVIDARRAEEQAAASRIGSRDVYLPFHDAIYRGDVYNSDAAIFGDPDDRDAGLPSAIVAALKTDDARKDETIVYAPLAIGRHVDHQIAYRAGLEMHRAGYRVRFFEDLPYALNEENVTTRMAQLGDSVEKAEAVAIGEVFETKIDAIMDYPSQLAVIFETYVGVAPTRETISEAMWKHATAAGDGVAVERYWKVAE